LVWYLSTLITSGLVWYLGTLITSGLVWYLSTPDHLRFGLVPDQTVLWFGLVWYLNGEGGDPFSVRIEHKLDDVITAEERK
jgi:hypothetical protein